MADSGAMVGAGKHVVLYGMFGIGNTGNDATLEVTVAALKRLIPGVRLTVVATHPDIVAKETGLACVAIRPEPRRKRLPGPLSKLDAEADRWTQARSLLVTADCLMIPGTGMFDDFGATAMQHAYQLWKWCSVAHQLKAPVKFVSVGAGPVERAWSRRLFRWTAMLADHRSYRDEKSKTFVSEVFGIDTSHDLVTPDLVFGLDITAPARPASEVRTVGIGVMDYHHWLGSGDAANDAYGPYMEKFSDFCAGLLEQGKALHILTGDIGDAPAVADLLKRLADKAPAHTDKILVPQARTLRELLNAIGETDIVVATRYHTIVGAMLCARPAVSIGYAAKNNAVMKEFGLEYYCQNIWDFNLDTLQAHVSAITVDAPAISARLHVVGAQLRKCVGDHFVRVASQITERETRS